MLVHCVVCVHEIRQFMPLHVVQLSTFHFSMSQNRIQTVFMKKTKHLELSKWFPRNFGYVWKKNRVLQVSMKKPKHLKLSVKKTKHLELSDFFYGYFKNIEFFCHFFIFQKIWQCLALCSCQGYRLIIAGCIKNDYVQKKIQTPWTILLVSIFAVRKKQSPWRIG